MITSSASNLTDQLWPLAAVAIYPCRRAQGADRPTPMPVILHPHSDFHQVMVKHPEGFEVILVKLDGVVHAYRNSCPHIGIGLDYGDGHCKHGERQLICNMHGALFDADTGYCTDGPCSGDSLTRLRVAIDAAGRVVA